MNYLKMIFGAAVLLNLAAPACADIPMTADISPQSLSDRVIKIRGKDFKFYPSRVRLQRGVPVTLELRSRDRDYTLSCPELDIASAITPAQVSKIRIVPQHKGTYVCSCGPACEKEHPGMNVQFFVEGSY